MLRHMFQRYSNLKGGKLTMIRHPQRTNDWLQQYRRNLEDMARTQDISWTNKKAIKNLNVNIEYLLRAPKLRQRMPIERWQSTEATWGKSPYWEQSYDEELLPPYCYNLEDMKKYDGDDIVIDTGWAVVSVSQKKQI